MSEAASPSPGVREKQSGAGAAGLARQIPRNRCRAIGALLHLTPLALLLPTACLPIPERIYHSPTIHGEVRRAGAPVADLPLALADRGRNADCANPTLLARSDSAGRFTFPARSTLWPVMMIGAHVSQRWLLCAGSQELANSSFYGIGGRRSVRIACDLDRMADSALAREKSARWNEPRRPGAPCGYVER